MTRNYLDQHLPKRIISALVCAVLFALIPKVTADLYFKYFDNTQYLIITQPLSVDKKTYKPCDFVILTTKLTAKIDVDVSSLTQLILLGPNGVTSRVGHSIEGMTPVRALSEHVVTSEVQLPCVLGDGQYLWQGNATYYVHGYPHTISFISDTFNVTQSGLSPAGDALQQQINELK